MGFDDGAAVLFAMARMPAPLPNAVMPMPRFFCPVNRATSITVLLSAPALQQITSLPLLLTP